MKWIGNAFIYFGLFSIYQATIGRKQYYSTDDFLVALLITTSCLELALGYWLISKSNESEQIVKDADAIEVINQKERLFFLYLRPFDTTNRFKLKDDHLNLFSWETWERDGFDDIERIISRALEPTYPIVALGRPGEHRGAARLLTSELEWRNTVKYLIHRAELIIVIPGPNPSTLWEIEQLKTGNFLGKCLFVMAPLNNIFYISENTDIIASWEKASRHCSTYGVELPKYISDGALFRIYSTNPYNIDIIPLPKPDPVEWTKAFQSLLEKR